MSTTAAELSNPLPTAKQAMEMPALAEAEMASEALRQKKMARREEGVDRQAVEAFWHFRAEALKRAAGTVQRAVKNGLTEVEAFRFPRCARTTAAPRQNAGRRVTA